MITPYKLLIGISAKQFPQLLYKYREAENDHTKKIITDNALWFSPPSKFNDPYDCNTPINPTTPLTEIKTWLTSVGVAPAYIVDFANRLKANPNIMKESTKIVLDTFGICCFSTLENSILQWSHYAKYHTGICLGFDLTKDPAFFILPIIVSYQQVMQHYNHFTQSDKIVDYLIKPKFHDWSYESEVRIVKSATEIDANNSRAFKFNDAALSEIIFGTNTPTATITQYKLLCANNNKPLVQFFKMELGKGAHYELEKKPC